MKSYFLSYSNKAFENEQEQLNASAIAKGGFTEVIGWNEKRLHKTEFYHLHKDILDRTRGGGYWLWKPYVILEQLKKVEDGDFVVYWDCGPSGRGNRFQYSIQPLLQWAIKNRGGIIPGNKMPWYGPNKKWTKRDCFVYMDCDQEKYKNHPQVQATFSIWQKNPKSLSFVQQWLDYCTDKRILTDEPNQCGLANDDQFIEHRHDQSVLTNLVIKEGLRCLEYPLDVNRYIDKDLDRLNRILHTPLVWRQLWFLRNRIRKKIIDFWAISQKS